MPSYVFKCTKCDTVFEEVRALKDFSEKSRCPDCRGKAEIQATKAHVHFERGVGGFHGTDYHPPTRQ